jgi:hypothetical protein
MSDFGVYGPPEKKKEGHKKMVKAASVAQLKIETTDKATL